MTAAYDNWVEKVQKKYNPQIVQDVTGLPEDEVQDFMKFCKLNDSFVSLSSEYDLVVAIQKCLQDYSDSNPEDTLRDN